MDSNWYPPYDAEPHSNGEHEPRASTDFMSIEQLQRLVHLLDHSDVSEIEVKHLKEGTRLVLRKAMVSNDDRSHEQRPVILPVPAKAVDDEKQQTPETKHIITAPLVGIFHSWAKPKGGTLVAVGDSVKVGQLVGTIQSLNVMNDVETSVAGHVAEILVQDGQAVEYGQRLMTIDTAEGT